MLRYSEIKYNRTVTIILGSWDLTDIELANRLTNCGGPWTLN